MSSADDLRLVREALWVRPLAYQDFAIAAHAALDRLEARIAKLEGRIEVLQRELERVERVE